MLALVKITDICILKMTALEQSCFWFKCPFAISPIAYGGAFRQQQREREEVREI